MKQTHIKFIYHASGHFSGLARPETINPGDPYSQEDEDLYQWVQSLLKENRKLQNERLADFRKLKILFLIAQNNLKKYPHKCGGKDYIKGFMTGLLECMRLLDPNMTSEICTTEPAPKYQLDRAPNYRFADTCLLCRHSMRKPDEDCPAMSDSFCTHYGAEVAEICICDDFDT